MPVGHLYRHPKTRGFYLRVRWPGDAKVSSTPLVPIGKKYATKNRAVALSIAKRLIAERTDDGSVPPGPNQIFDAYRLSNSLKAKTDTVNRNQAILRIFFAYAGRPVHEVRVEDVEAYLGHLQAAKRAAKTVKSHLTALRAFFRWAMRRHHADADPTESVELRPVPKRPPVSPPAESVATLLQRAESAPIKYRDDLILAVRIAAEAGLRLEEMMKLRRRALLDQGGTYALLVGEEAPTKSHGWRVVPLPASTAKVILSRNLQPGDRVFRRVVKWTWNDRLKKHAAGLSGFNARKGTGALWHALRSYCATEKAATYPPDGLVYRLMYELGWSSPDMAQRYIDVARAGAR